MEAGSEASLLGIPYPTTLVVPEGTPGLCVALFENPGTMNTQLLAKNRLATNDMSLSFPMKSHQISLIPLSHRTALQIFGHSSQVSPESTFP